MKPEQKISRREFAGTSAAAFTIVPAHVPGGKGHTAPSDILNIACIGCGTQGLREMVGLIIREKLIML